MSRIRRPARVGRWRWWLHRSGLGYSPSLAMTAGFASVDFAAEAGRYLVEVPGGQVEIGTPGWSRADAEAIAGRWAALATGGGSWLRLPSGVEVHLRRTARLRWHGPGDVL